MKKLDNLQRSCLSPVGNESFTSGHLNTFFTNKATYYVSGGGGGGGCCAHGGGILPNVFGGGT